IDSIDEADRELEHRQENAELGTRREAQIARPDLVVIPPSPAGIREPDEAQRIVHTEDVLRVEDRLLVSAGNDRLSVERLVGTERAVLESAHGVLAADEEALSLRDAQPFAVDVRRNVELVMALHMFETVNEREAVESMEAITVSNRSTFAQLLVPERKRVIRCAIEQRHAETVRSVKEPGIGIRQREEVQSIAGLEAEAEIFAFAEEVTC